MEEAPLLTDNSTAEMIFSAIGHRNGQERGRQRSGEGTAKPKEAET
jgi:hypothetical protein